MRLIALIAFTLALRGQDFPSMPPDGIAFFTSYNQLGSPRFTGGVSAVYRVASSLGLYGTTTADLYPKLAFDIATNRKFYAISATIRQGVHKDVWDSGRCSVLMGGDAGPGFSQALPSGISVSLTGSFVVTGVCQLSPVFSLVVPVRMLYVANAGWNPVGELGFVINFKKPAKANAACGFFRTRCGK